MKKRDQKFIEEWTETQKKGKWKYAFQTGIIWGILVAVFTSLIELFSHSFSEIFFSKFFVISIIVYLIGGVFLFGITMWYYNEYYYSKLLKK